MDLRSINFISLQKIYKGSKEQTRDLLKFLKTFDKNIQETVLWLREFVWDLYPQTNELIYDNYNALALGWSPTEKVGHVFCGIALYSTNKNIHFSFYWGSEISDPKKILIGEGKQYRYILVKNIGDFPKAYIKTLLKDEYNNSLLKVKDKNQLIQGMTITKSI